MVLLKEEYALLKQAAITVAERSYKAPCLCGSLRIAEMPMTCVCHAARGQYGTVQKEKYKSKIRYAVLWSA